MELSCDAFPVQSLIDQAQPHLRVASVGGHAAASLVCVFELRLNPDESVWNHLRQNGVTKTPLKQNEQLKDRVEKDLAQIKRSPRLVRSFFRAESVGYIMD
jgi:hypothetical protein